MSCSPAVLWAFMAGQSRNSTSVFSAPEVGWSIMIQYSVCSSLICSPSTLSLSKAFHFLIVYLWQQKQPTEKTADHLSFCMYSQSGSFVVNPWFPFVFGEDSVAHRWQHKIILLPQPDYKQHKTSNIRNPYHMTRERTLAINREILGACMCTSMPL